MPYKVKGKCIYKKDTGKKVGCTKGDIKDYLAALHTNVIDESTNKLQFTKPKFEFEWMEAIRYPEFEEMGKDGWVEIAKNGHTEIYSDIKDVLGNVDLDFNSLEEPKKERFHKAFNNRKIETPIAVKFSDSDYDLVAGNTRLSGLVNNGITNFPIWIVDISHLMENMINENFNEVQFHKQEYYRGVGLDEAIKACESGHLIYFSNDPMPYDWEVIEYSMGGEARDASEEDIENFVKSIVYWKPINKGVNLTTDLENAMGYSDIVLTVNIDGDYAEFSDSHIFARNPNECKVIKVYYKHKEYTPQEFLNLGKNMINEDKIKGGKADKITKEDIAKKFGVTVDNINKELEMGVEVELEHTKSRRLAKEIAMDHLTEIPDYYTRLKKMEKQGESKWKKREKKLDESLRDYICDLIRINLNN